MARWYDPRQKIEILHSLGINALHGKVTGDEAARILTWRAKEEYGVTHKYTPSILRRHVESGNLQAYPGTKLTEDGKSRKNLYDADAVFELEIAPRRGMGRKQVAKEGAA